MSDWTPLEFTSRSGEARRRRRWGFVVSDGRTSGLQPADGRQQLTSNKRGRSASERSASEREGKRVMSGVRSRAFRALFIVLGQKHEAWSYRGAAQSLYAWHTPAASLTAETGGRFPSMVPVAFASLPLYSTVQYSNSHRLSSSLTTPWASCPPFAVSQVSMPDLLRSTGERTGSYIDNKVGRHGVWIIASHPFIHRITYLHK